MNASLKSDTALYGAAVMAERLLGLLLLPLLTRRLTASEYGVWSQTLVVSSVLMPLVLFGLPAAIVKFFSAGVPQDLRRRWMWRSLGFGAVVLGVLALIAGVAQDAVALAVYGSVEQRAYVPVLVMLLAADGLLDLLIAYLRAGFRMRWIALLMLARGGLRFGFLLAALSLWRLPFERAFATLALLQLTIAMIGFMLELRRRLPVMAIGTPEGGAIRWRAMLAFSAPLVLVALLTSVNGFADRFVLTHLLGLDALAVYAAASSLVSITNVAYTVLGFTLFPVLSRLWSQGDVPGAVRLAGETVRVFLFIALPYALWLACVIGSLLPLLTTQAYRVPGSVALMLGLAAVGYGLYQIMLYLLLLSGRGMRAAWLMLAAAVLNGVLNLLLVPSHGLTGAAAAALASNGLLAVGAYAATQSRFPWDGALRATVGAAAAAAAAWAVDRSWSPGTWAGVSMSLLLAALIYFAADLLCGRSVIRAYVWRKETP